MAAVRSLMLAAAVVLLTAARHPPAPGPAPEPAPVAAPTIKAGVEKWRAGDYVGAVAIWQPFAAAGDADALFNLGQAYKLGRGVDADSAAARDYYRKAAVKGHLPAQANLGIALFQAGEKPEAIKWLKTAADRGEARAQYVLGIAAFNGDGVPRSQSLGYGYLLRAQASGLPQAATALGTIAPGLSPGDRTGGEAIAASLAAGTGVPAGLAAASAPRPIAGTPPARATASLPVVTPPTVAAPPVTAGSAALPAALTAPAARPASPVVTATAPPPPPARVPVAPVRATVLAADTGPRPATPPPAADRPTPAAPHADAPALPPVAKAAPPKPIREPTPAQADAAAGAPPHSAVATLDLPASRPASDVPKADAARTATGGADPLAPSARAATRPATPLKPFVADEPARKPDGWRVQLGAFSSRKLADAAWADAKATAGPAKPVFATDGAVTKLQMGPFATRDAAKVACTRLTAAGRACFVTQG